jgi:hypothetical protein
MTTAIADFNFGYQALSLKPQRRIPHRQKRPDAKQAND